MHHYVAVPLLHYSPVLLLQKRSEKQWSAATAENDLQANNGIINLAAINLAAGLELITDIKPEVHEGINGKCNNNKNTSTSDALGSLLKHIINVFLAIL